MLKLSQIFCSSNGHKCHQILNNNILGLQLLIYQAVDEAADTGYNMIFHCNTLSLCVYFVVFICCLLWAAMDSESLNKMLNKDCYLHGCLFRNWWMRQAKTIFISLCCHSWTDEELIGKGIQSNFCNVTHMKHYCNESAGCLLLITTWTTTRTTT